MTYPDRDPRHAVAERMITEQFGLVGDDLWAFVNALMLALDHAKDAEIFRLRKQVKELQDAK